MEYFTFGAEQEDVGTRIDVFLADAMENLSRSGVQKLIEEGHITLNGGRTKANYKLRERDIIDVEVPEVKEVEILPEDIPLDILYEDADVIVGISHRGWWCIRLPDIRAAHWSMR